MIGRITHNGTEFTTDFSNPKDISIPLRGDGSNPNCYWADLVSFEVIRSGDFVGSVADGGPVDYKKVVFTPHGNGTHTECYGHISSNEISINKSLSSFHFIAELISVTPTKNIDGDEVVSLEEVRSKIQHGGIQALVIRTMPNDKGKLSRQYSGTNPPYLADEVTAYLAEIGISHLLVDLPSVDKEVDGGKLAAHNAFWSRGDEKRLNCTITELIYVPDIIGDGLYLLNLQIASFELDASPSKPVLFELKS